jgi:hypothetical protein
VEYRSMALDKPPPSVMEEDARHIIRVAFRLLSRWMV